MSSPRSVLALLGLVVAVTCMAAPRGAEATVSCGQVVRYLMPCVSYVSSGGAVPQSCCSGIKTLYGQAATTSDRQGVCACLKNAINGFSYNGYNVGLAAGLPAKCGLNIPYKISPTTDCNSVK